MSELFGAFWSSDIPLPEKLLDALNRPNARSNWHGEIHRLGHAIVVTPSANLATSDQVIVAFSGELNNHTELLQESGLASSSSDAQIVLALLTRYSLDEVLARLNGAFALVYWDCQKKLLHLIRDQLGQAFLFHTTLEEYGCTLFSDSLPRLTAVSGVDLQLDYTAMADYLSLGYIPAPRTAYKKISKVAPSTEDSGEIGKHPTPRRYWQPGFLPQAKVTWEEAREEALRVLSQATRRLLRRHPEADFMLSGGIDSGTVMGLACHIAPDATRRAYSIAFSEQAYDESELAGGTARRCGVPLQIHHLSPRNLNALDALLANSGEPYADSSLLPTAAATRDTSRTALFTGDGGDEVFGGYRRYQAMLMRNRIPAWIQLLFRYPCRWTAALLPTPRDNRSRLANLVRSLKSMGLPPVAAYGSFQQIASKSLRDRLLATPTPHDYLEDWDKLAQTIPVAHPVQRYNALDLMVYLPDDGFRKTNLAAEGTGVSYLCPILDMDVVRFALSLPLEYRFNVKENKRLLREIGKDSLDPRILNQPKRGFGTPVADWFRNELAPLAQKLADEVSDWDIHKLLNPQAVQRVVMEHLQGKVSHGPLLWTLYCLKLWENA